MQTLVPWARRNIISGELGTEGEIYNCIVPFDSKYSNSHKIYISTAATTTNPKPQPIHYRRIGQQRIHELTDSLQLSAILKDSSKQIVLLFGFKIHTESEKLSLVLESSHNPNRIKTLRNKVLRVCPLSCDQEHILPAILL